jgi:predicted methyltransferase MtxX (methanogen marker protein 4)
MRHVLVSCTDDTLVRRLRAEAADNTMFLSESGIDETLERLGRSARIDAVITDDEAVVRAIREEIPGTLPIYLTAPGEDTEIVLDGLAQLIDGN